MFDRINKSLGAKVIIAVSAVLLVFITLFSYLDYKNESRTILNIYRKNAKLLSLTVQKGLISAMEEGRNEDVQKVLQDVGTQEEIVGVRVFDPNGNILRSTRKGEIGGMVDKATMDLFRSGSGGGITVSSDDLSKVMSFVTPIYNGPQCFGCHPPQTRVNGVLNVNVSMEDAYAEIAASRWSMAKWGGLTILAVVLAEAYLLRRLVSDRVVRLRSAMRQAERGEEFVLDFRYQDELGELGQVFKGMMERIESLHSSAVDSGKELVRSQEKLRAQTILASVIDAMPDGVAIINKDMKIVQTNPRHREIFPTARVGEPCYFCIHKRDTVCPHCGLVKVFEDGRIHDHHSRVTRTDGSSLIVHSISAPILDPDGRILNAVEVVRDVTERVELEKDLKEKSWELERANKKLSKMAVTDGLTMLFNRRYFQDSLSREFKRLARHRAQPLLALAMIDIDHFKQLNDTYGHQAGDFVLRSLSKTLRNSVRMTDVVARFGGEEFVVIMPETDAPGMKVLAERLREAVENMALVFEGRELTVTVSVGLASFPGSGIASEDELVKAADRALYKAKEQGRNRVVMG